MSINTKKRHFLGFWVLRTCDLTPVRGSVRHHTFREGRGCLNFPTYSIDYLFRLYLIGFGCWCHPGLDIRQPSVLYRISMVNARWHRKIMSFVADPMVFWHNFDVSSQKFGESTQLSIPGDYFSWVVPPIALIPKRSPFWRFGAVCMQKLPRLRAKRAEGLWKNKTIRRSWKCNF